MADKEIYQVFDDVRIQTKHDTEANWLKAVDFIPLQGEQIIYDEDDKYPYKRMKVGDGKTVVSSLPFSFQPVGELWLTDRATKKKYKMYVENGKVKLEEEVSE